MTKPFAIGIDIGGTNTSLGLVDRRGEILLQSGLRTTDYETLDAYIADMEQEVARFRKRAGVDNISGIGVGAPNGNYYTGEIVDAANLRWKGVIPMAKMMSEAMGYKVTLTNDANASAMGEMMYGAARGMKDFVVVTLGTGVGSGFVANGQVVYGHTGFAGELGHVIAVQDGRQCGCGRKGCMERYCSATGIVHTANEWLEERKEDSLLRNYSTALTAKNIHEAALAGDELAIEIFDYTGMILGRTLANAVAITSPQAVILFGGLARAGEVLFDPVKKYMEENLLSVFKNTVELLPSALPDADAAILGASALAW